jgi:SAM-dependent methyltransferase
MCCDGKCDNACVQSRHASRPHHHCSTHDGYLTVPVYRLNALSAHTAQSMKTYDRAYFERWYRDPQHRVSTRDSLERKVHLAVSVAEFILCRRIRTVLDVGCGEAPWAPVLRRMRRGIRYIGVESSEYAIARFGKARNVRRGTLGDLGALRLPRDIDLIVCADVLQYADALEVERGLRAIRRLLGGVAYIEAFATEDGMDGDQIGWHKRSADVYRRVFRKAGLTQCGPHCYVDLVQLDGLITFEHMNHGA